MQAAAFCDDDKKRGSVGSSRVCSKQRNVPSSRELHKRRAQYSNSCSDPRASRSIIRSRTRRSAGLFHGCSTTFSLLVSFKLGLKRTNGFTFVATASQEGSQSFGNPLRSSFRYSRQRRIASVWWCTAFGSLAEDWFVAIRCQDGEIVHTGRVQALRERPYMMGLSRLWSSRRA